MDDISTGEVQQSGAGASAYGVMREHDLPLKQEAALVGTDTDSKFIYPDADSAALDTGKTGFIDSPPGEPLDSRKVVGDTNWSSST